MKPNQINNLKSEKGDQVPKDHLILQVSHQKVYLGEHL